MPPRHFTDSRTTNFYYSFLFLPPEKRQAIEAVYDFARRSDDAADDLHDSEAAASGICRYRELLDRCYEKDGPPLEGRALKALTQAIRRFNIPRQPFDDLLLGLEMDLRMDRTGRFYRTFEEVELYCYRVASTIGLIAIEIFGYRNPQTKEYAVNLGKALQMVNILRDVHGDGERRRVYLPLEDLERFGIDPAKLAGRCYSDSFARLMRFESLRARDYFERARLLLPREDRKSMVAAEIMGAIYWRLLRRMENRSFDVFGPRVKLSRPRKLWTALEVYLGAEWHQ
ncbi:MAG: squalene/phytoene synthase family protein [Terriglobia bacterium]